MNQSNELIARLSGHFYSEWFDNNMVTIFEALKKCDYVKWDKIKCRWVATKTFKISGKSKTITFVPNETILLMSYQSKNNTVNL